MNYTQNKSKDTTRIDNYVKHYEDSNNLSNLGFIRNSVNHIYISCCRPGLRCTYSK